MTPHDELRLLPWSGLDGKPCFLSTDDASGHLSRLADEVEADQLGRAADLVAEGLMMTNKDQPERQAPEGLTAALIEALQNTLRVATSRGHRLAIAQQTFLETYDPRERPLDALD
ncbi:hypothetical protein AB0C89_24530 [Streptomyces sp. NPDC048491]|uniref:hypothetical protein n=1 Tax=Streptomyces sp. NPDC048491 TaxID=3157207 RepID=UPI0034124592